MKSVFYAGAALLAISGITGTANAAETFNGTIVLTGGPDFFTGAFNQTHTTDFVDTWTFSTPGAGLLDASIISIAFGAASDINFTEVTLNGVQLVIDNGKTVSSAVAASQIFTDGSLNTLMIAGTSGSSASYGGTVNFEIPAVPEPATWAMMIAGFGIAGAAMRRRRTTIAFA